MRLVIVTAILAIACSCGTDAKGGSCGLLDMLVDSEGGQYCPDEGAPDDCEALNDSLVDAAVVCANGAITEEELRAELDEGGVLNNCDGAVATSTDYDACKDALDDVDDPPCEGSLIAAPDTCVGAVLVQG